MRQVFLRMIGAAVCALLCCQVMACAGGQESARAKQRERVVEGLQHQLAQQQDRIEQLQQRLVVLESRKGHAKSVSEDRVQSLAVVRLSPDASSSTPESEFEPLAVVSIPAAPALGQPQSTGSKHPLFSKALKAYQAGRWSAAAYGFETYAREQASAADAPRAYFWAGEARFQMGHYQPAVDAYRIVLEKYPESPKAADALLKAGISFKKMKKPEQASRFFRNLVVRYPKSAVADLARGHLKNGQSRGGSS